MADTPHLTDRHCRPCKSGDPALGSAAVDVLLSQLEGWALVDQRISKTFAFQDYYRTLAFVNAVAFMAHREDHHPDLQVGYNRCTVEYSTHAVGGLSENDFICAAKVDALYLS